jgi:hypothetical protein
MKQIDLHVHSTASDGTFTPTMLVDEAVKKGLAAFALTDHDSVDGINEGLAAAEKAGIELIPGIEFSTFYDKKEIHIVGLFIDHKNSEFTERLNVFKDGRENKNIKMCEKFEEIGIHVSYDEMKSMYAGSVITRAHFADYLLKKGIVKDRNEAFEKYIGDGKKCYVDREKITPKEAIELIHSVGGVAVLAHPVLYHLGSDMMGKLMDYLCENGIQALEAIYSTYSMGEELEMRNLAKKYNLLISGGSDFHGANKPHIQLGTGMGKLFVPYDVLEGLRGLRA